MAAMKTGIPLLLLLISLTGYALPQPARTDPVAAAEITRSIEEINHAFVARDYHPFERFYTDNYVSIRSQPIFNSKQQLMAMMKADAAFLEAGGRLDFETISYENDRPEIHVFGTTAIVNVAKRNFWSYRDSKCLTRYQATETWVTTEAGWRLLASHATTFQCDRAPWMPLHKAVAAVGTITAPPPTTEADAPAKAIFDPANTSRRVFAPGFASTNVEGVVETGTSASLAVTEAINAPDRENEALVASGDTAVFMFRVNRKRADLRVPVQYSVVAARQDGKWRIVAAHATW